MSLFSRGRQRGLCSVRFAALLTHLLELLSEVQLLSLRQLVSVEALVISMQRWPVEILFSLTSFSGDIFAKQAIPVAKSMIAPERLMKSTDPSKGTYRLFFVLSA